MQKAFKMKAFASKEFYQEIFLQVLDVLSEVLN